MEEVDKGAQEHAPQVDISAFTEMMLAEVDQLARNHRSELNACVERWMRTLQAPGVQPVALDAHQVILEGHATEETPPRKSKRVSAVVSPSAEGKRSPRTSVKPSVADKTSARHSDGHAVADKASWRNSLRHSSGKKSRRDFHASGVVDAEEEIAFFENLQRIRKAFKDNDLNEDGVITAQELVQLADELGDQVTLDSLENVERMIDELKTIAKNRGFDDERLDEEGMPFEIFARILYSHDDTIDEHLQESVRLMRTFFRDCTNARILAEAADVDMWDVGGDHCDKPIGERIMPFIDPLMGCVIFMNAICIGISIDHNDPTWVEYLEYAFVTLYVAEVLFKIKHYGAPDFFLGVDWHWHWFDTALACIGIVDAGIAIAGNDDVDLGPLMYLRLLRIARLVRLVRLMRAFKDLSIMVTGLLAGLKTMMWVMIILALVIYSMAVLLTSAVGRDETSRLPYRKELFSTVTRSMFTMFVCLTDGCTNYDGTPISHSLFDIYGIKFFLAYCVSMVVVTFGLFNLIMAIFVENTMEAAKSNHTAIAAARHKENLRVARKLKLVIRQFTVAQSSHNRTQRFKMLNEVEAEMKRTEGLRGLIRSLSMPQEAQNQPESLFAMTGGDELELKRDQFDKILVTRAVQALMDELEIDETDRKGLFEVLDSDGSGTLTIEELVSGLMAVRGQAKKSDTVATMLAVKSVQKSLRTTAALLLQNHHWVDERLQRQEEQLERQEEAQQQLTSKVEAMLNTLPFVVSKS